MPNIFTKEVIMAGTGCTEATAIRCLPMIQTACEKYEITTRNRLSAFLANVGEESGQLTKTRENLNYSSQGLADTWPNRFAVDSKAKIKKPNPLAVSLARKPEAIANSVYANRLGNGDEASGDGWKYRGVGWIQTTGKENIQRALIQAGYSKTEDPSVLESPIGAAMSAAYFWNRNGCNGMADGDMFSMTVVTVNGKAPSAANDGASRIANYRGANKLIKEMGA